MKTITLTIFGFTLITGALTLGVLRPNEPTYRDRKLTVWLEDLDSMEWSKRIQSAEAIRAIGTNALPTLTNRLRAKDSFVKDKLIHLFEYYPIIDLVPAEARNESALEACRILGPKAGPLTPEIIRFLADHRRTKAVKVLVAIGDSAIRPLEKALASEDEQARAGAAAALGGIARQPQAVVVALMERLNDSGTETRMAAAWALGRFGAEAHAALPRLSALTNDSAYNVRAQAGVAIDRIVR